jgi:hypothetical protein
MVSEDRPSGVTDLPALEAEVQALLERSRRLYLRSRVLQSRASALSERVQRALYAVADPQTLPGENVPQAVRWQTDAVSWICYDPRPWMTSPTARSREARAVELHRRGLDLLCQSRQVAKTPGGWYRAQVLADNAACLFGEAFAFLDEARALR